MGGFLGLNDQKSRAQNKYLQRADLAGASSSSTNNRGEPTCATEDHSFMGRQPGEADTLPGWHTIRDTTGL